MNDFSKPTNEPRFMRIARNVMDVFTPAGIDALLLGFIVGLGSGILFLYWWFQL